MASVEPRGVAGTGAADALSGAAVQQSPASRRLERAAQQTTEVGRHEAVDDGIETRVHERQQVQGYTQPVQRDVVSNQLPLDEDVQ